MIKSNRIKMLFTGYAPVHFICFLPLYKRLIALQEIDIYVSGGLRTKSDDGYIYDEKSMYRSFNLPRDRILSIDKIKELDFDVLFSAHTKLILPRSVKKKIQIFHGISYRNKAVRPENMLCDNYFIVGPYMNRRFTEAGLMKKDDERAIPIGFMKTDNLLNVKLNREKILHDIDLVDDRPIILYAPTGAKENSLETIGEDIIRQLADAGKYNLIIKLHDHPKKKINWVKRLERYTSAQCKIAKESDVTLLLSIADVLITDASSVCNEFTLVDRPIVFLDTPVLLEKARDANNSMLDLDTWGRKGGSVCERPDQIIKTIDHCLENPGEKSEIRQAMAKDFFYNPGKATNAAMSWIENNILIDRTITTKITASE